MDLDDLIKKNEKNIIFDLQKLIQIPSVESKPSKDAPFGKEVKKALEVTLDIAKKLGLKNYSKDNYYGVCEIGKGSLLGAVLVHLDVVPEGDDWSYPPFKGEISNGKIYGRGVEDNKGPAIASLYALYIIKSLNIKLYGRIRIIFGTNEETDWGGVDYYKKNDEIPDYGITPDAKFPLIFAEKEILRVNFKQKFESKTIISIEAGNAVNMVPDRAEAKLIFDEKIICKIKENIENFPNIKIINTDKNIIIKAKGKSAHGSVPSLGENAISKLLEFLKEIIQEKDGFTEFLDFYQEKINFETTGKSFGINFDDGISGELTFNSGILKVKNNKIILKIDIRSPVKINSEKVLKNIISNTPKFIEVEKEKSVKGLYIPIDSKLIQTLLKVYRDITGDNTEPMAIGGGTYARAFENTVAFGVSFPNKESLAHQKDEFIKISDLMLVVKILTKALIELDKVMGS